MIRPWFEQACDSVDAAIFTGDTLYVPEELTMLKEYLGRWQRAVVEHEANNQPEAWEVATNERPA